MSGAMKRIKVAVTEDHPIMLKGLRNMLSEYDHFQITGSYATGNALLAGLQKTQPDVLLMDIDLPDITGEELTQTVVKRYPDIKILVLTSHDNIFFVRSLLRIGAIGYLLKTTDEEDLVAAIGSAAAGLQALSPAIKDLLVKDTLKLKQTIVAPTELTQREKEILQLIAEEYTSQEIGDKLFLSSRTVDNYRFGLMQKLDVKNMAGLIKKAIKMGLIE